MKKFIISLLILLTTTIAKAQFTTYSSYDNEVEAVYEVEDMDSYEIKDYNRWTKEGDSHESSLMYLNAYRAQINLLSAPATIIKYHFYKEEDESSALRIDVELINTSPKTIKEITLEFEFENNGSSVYDIKTGDEYLILKYSNLSGRTKSDLYEDVAKSIFKCYHLLRYEDATYKKLFYNKKATLTRLHSAKIKYADGTTSTKIAIFDGGSLLENGPLSPIVKYVEHNKKVEQEKTRKEEEKKKRELEEAAIQKKREEEAEERRKWEVTGPLGKTYSQKYDYEPQKVAPQEDEDEVYTSAAHMPSFPGGDNALLKYINSNMKYPVSAKDNNIQGKVVVQFVVKKDGSIGKVKIVRGVVKELDNEAKRIVGMLPKFTPARNAVGDPVNVWYVLPVTFKLPSTY